MITINWDNQKLQPVLITYNRAPYLEKTLKAFLNAGLSSMELHVLDNASTDATPEVVRSIQNDWPTLQYHRNQYNIGGNGNILRAVEIVGSEYAWVIGDDDEWHLENVRELIEVLERNSADAIRLGWLVADHNRGREESIVKLALEEPLFFASVSMISATIIRRRLILEVLPQAYMNIGDAYPQLVPFLVAAQRAELSVFTLATDLLTHTPNAAPGYYFGDLEWYSAWFRTSRHIVERNMRVKFIGEIARYMTRDAPSRLNGFLWYSKVALTYKARKIPQGRYLTTMLAYGAGARASVMLAAILYLLTPRAVAQRLLRAYKNWRGESQRRFEYDRGRL